MQIINMKMNGDGAWPELRDKKVVELPKENIDVAVLDRGTLEGNPTIMFKVEDDGVYYVLEMSVKNLQMIAAATHGKYGDIT